MASHAGYGAVIEVRIVIFLRPEYNPGGTELKGCLADHDGYAAFIVVFGRAVWHVGHAGKGSGDG